MPTPHTSLQLQSFLGSDAQLRLKLAVVPISEPAEDEVVIRVEASPINPSDIGAMIGPADLSRMRAEETGGGCQLVVPMPAAGMRAMAARVDQPFPAGIEGAGVVVGAGSSPNAQALIGKVVAASMGGMYAQYRVAKVADLLVTKDGTTPVEAASSFVNPLTALGMVETMYRDGHTALVHTAAASNLGRMLNRVCLADAIPLVNIVRSEAQVGVLREIGATNVLDLNAPTFLHDLAAAVKTTGATLCFDVIGGGKLASQILAAMEAAQMTMLAGYQRYGSSVHKQVYICGLLDTNPTELTHSFGLAWGIGGWLLNNFLLRIGSEATGRLKARVADELGTTFASTYTRTISLREALDPAIVAAYQRRATGEKFLIAPQIP